MTEDEAKTKRCCGPEGCGEWKQPEHPSGAGARWCIGSACMAWRWIEKHPHRWNDGSYATNSNAPRGSAEGFCGLASKP